MKKIVLLLFFCIASVFANAQESRVQLYVTPEDFGCVSGDSKFAAHNSEKLQEMVNYAIKNGVKVTSNANKNYYIASGIVINGPISVDFNRAKLIATDTTDMVVIIGRDIVYAGVVSGFNIDMNNVAKTGIYVKYAMKLRITNCMITGIPTNAVGMKIEKGGEAFVDNIHFMGGQNLATGLKVTTADCHFSDMVMMDCHTAVDNLGFNYYERIHGWMGDEGKWIDGSMFFRVRGGSVFLNQCFCDTYDIGFQMDCQSSLFISQLRNFHNMVMWRRDVDRIHPVFFNFADETVAEKSFITLTDSYIGGLFTKGINRQLFSNVDNHNIKIHNTKIE